MWDGQVVKCHEAADAGGDDGAGAGESDLVGNIGGVVQGEVAVVEGMVLGGGVIMEFFNGGFEEADAAVIAEAVDIAGEFADAIKA